MTPEAILSRPPRILGQAQRERYFEEGYVGAPDVVGGDWLARLNACTAAYVEESRRARDDRRFDLEPDHSAAAPRIRRLNSPTDVDALYWEFASTGPFVDVAEDLLGPDVKFHHSKLNFKWSGGGEEVKWHQDIQFWPHTNYDVLTIGVYLEDVDDRMAPMGVVPKSHDGPLYDLRDGSGNWTGHIRAEDLPGVGVERAGYLAGPAGTVTVHNCRAIHGSAPNWSAHPRPLLLCAYAAADAIPITNLVSGARHGDELVRGAPARWARFDPRPCLLPPDFSKRRHMSIFEHQQRAAALAPGAD